MKVALFRGSRLPDSGGDYVFEKEIFRSLVDFGNEGKHEFVIFDLFNSNRHRKPEVSAKHIHHVAFHRGFRERIRSKTFRTASRVLKKLRNPYTKLNKENIFEDFVVKSGVEIIWYLTPYNWNFFTTKLPYIYPVWDLQHRLQPYFPEVSCDGQWEKRERMYQMALGKARVVIAGTKAGKAEIERFYRVPVERIRILPHPTPRFAIETPPGDGKEILAKYGIPAGYLFYPAQFWPHKNHAGLLSAVKSLRDRYNVNFSVVFVGSDKGNEQCIRQIVKEFGLSPQVHFLGFVPEGDLVLLYRNAFALIYPTFFGPENLPPLEAFALGCPVIASDVSGAREQLEDAALFADPRKPEQIAEMINLLYNNISLRQQLISRGLKRASRWTGKDFIKGIFRILDDFKTKYKQPC